MKIAVVFDSRTGNTKMVAEAVAGSIREETGAGELVYFGEAMENIEADLYFVGSWTDKGMCSEKICAFLKMLKNKKTAYFGTAGFGGSAEYYQTLFDRIKTNIDDSCTVVTPYFCQGRMPDAVRARYEKMLEANPGDARAKASLLNFDKALSHPDEADLAGVRKWVREVLREAAV